MRIQQNGFLYQLTFLTHLFPVNCYFIEENHEVTLIDAALPYSYKGILKAAEKIGKPITRILLTHAHEDHVGALDKLSEQLPNVEIIISERDSRLLMGDKTLLANEPNMPIKGGAPKGLKAKPHRLIQDGDTIGSLQAIHTPGHTPGHMAFFDTRTNAIVAGDALQTRGGIAVAGKVNPLFPFPAFGTWSANLSVVSTQKLVDLNPSLLAVGHGNLLENPVNSMKKAIIDAKESLRRKGN